MEYRLGDIIEVVKKQEDGVSPMYYEANITGRRFLVRYETRRVDTDNPQSDLLQEWVDEADIKHIPPYLSYCETYRNEAIDVFWGGAWRLGRILAKRNNYNYRVELVGSLNNEVMLAHVSRIRVHLDRSIDGAWLTRPAVAD